MNRSTIMRLARQGDAIPRFQPPYIFRTSVPSNGTIMSEVVTCQPSTTAWRLRPGYLSEHGSSQESVHILLGRFLADHQAKSALASRSLLADNQAFRWGRGKPLEIVLNCSPISASSGFASHQRTRG